MSKGMVALRGQKHCKLRQHQQIEKGCFLKGSWLFSSNAQRWSYKSVVRLYSVVIAATPYQMPHCEKKEYLASHSWPPTVQLYRDGYRVGLLGSNSRTLDFSFEFITWGNQVCTKALTRSTSHVQKYSLLSLSRLMCNVGTCFLYPLSFAALTQRNSNASAYIS